MPAAAEDAQAVTDVARRHRDPDLLALGLSSQGRLALYSGRIADGLALLDEAMAGAAAHELTPVVFGHVYCAAIEGCQEIADFGRVAEWTSALHRWCLDQPGLVAFTGQCSVHRGQLMRVHGAWPEALEEFASAVARYRLADSVAAIGLAECERGDVLRQRGEYGEAEAAYQRSSEHGYDPQPGLALLWLARGANDAALAAARRLLEEVSEPVAQCRLLPHAIEVLVTAGALEEARAAVGRLDEVAAHVGTETLQAYAAYSSGTLELACGDAAGALPYLRKARQLWAHAQNPYEGARVRLVTGRALAAVGDAESARKELETAFTTFRELGATPDAEEVERLLRPTDHPAGLTQREVEVLRLVAVGPEQRPGRGGAGAEREDGGSPPLEHLRQAGGRVTHRRGGVRLRAPSRLGPRGQASSSSIDSVVERADSNLRRHKSTGIQSEPRHFMTCGKAAPPRNSCTNTLRKLGA